jgi:hypothetical protein
MRFDPQYEAEHRYEKGGFISSQPKFPSLIERIEGYMSENGWTQWSDGRWANDQPNRTTISPTLGRALDIQFARDAKKEAGK